MSAEHADAMRRAVRRAVTLGEAALDASEATVTVDPSGLARILQLLHGPGVRPAMPRFVWHDVYAPEDEWQEDEPIERRLFWAHRVLTHTVGPAQRVEATNAS